MFKKVACLVTSCLVLIIPQLWAQSSIGGTLSNPVTSVTAYNAVSNTMDVASTVGFSMGDTVLIIQMKGATIDGTNTAAFGNVTAIGNAGKYEFAVVCDIAGNTVTFDYQMVNSYTVSGHVQMIRVPVFDNVVVNSALTENSFNGSTGGVLVFSARGWVRLDFDINMAGKGFKGGWDYSNYAGGGCSCGCAPGGGPQFPDYSYPTASCRAADKGEGIADSLAGQEFGKGKEANGGGGGNDHNSGGAGGGNFGVGGLGGISNSNSCFFGAYCRGLNPGIGGLGLGAGYISNLQNRVFLGGGGGAGHDNNGTGTAGGPGGGIVIILADSINLNGRTIRANGALAGSSTSDGAGGGGAGGAILLSCLKYSGAAGTLDVRGGKGGDDNWGAVGSNCKGPGGGGGGGVIWSSVALPGAIVTQTTGGVNGTNCTGAAGSTPGAVGGILTGLIPPISITNFAGCNLGILPMSLLRFEARQENLGILLSWTARLDANSYKFEIQKEGPGGFSKIGEQNTGQPDGSPAQFVFTDKVPIIGYNKYRLRQIDLDGASSYSEIREVNYTLGGFGVGNLYPNPMNQADELNFEVMADTPVNAQLSVSDLQGKIIWEKKAGIQIGTNHFSVPATQMKEGIYFLKVNSSSKTIVKKFVVIK